MPEAATRAEVVHDPSGGLSSVRGVHETNRARALNLIIEPQGERFRLTVQTADPELQQAFGDDVEHELPVGRTELWGLVQECRAAWRQHLVDLVWRGGYAFQNRWDFSQNRKLLAGVLPQVAEAGSKLFLALFYPQLPGDRERYSGLRRLGKVLRREMSRRTRWLRVSSDSFFVPWSLIYSDRLALDGSDVRPEGFWGYQHLIEHSPPGHGHMANELRLGDGLDVGLQFDRAIDTKLDVQCLAPVLELLDGYRLTRKERPTKKRLAEALRAGPLADQVLFFCCHAEQEGDFGQPRIDQAYLVLSDPQQPAIESRITPADIRFWIDMEELQGRPLVFLNACGSGQLNSVFYPGFGTTFLGLGASSVIGAQTELPAVFAGEFAKRFFTELFRGGPQNSVGEVLFRLRRQFLDVHNNPLGLIYSLYRGADCHFEKPVPTA